MSTLTRPVTYNDLLQMTDMSGNRYEIIGGELVVCPSPAPKHQRLVIRLTDRFLELVVRPGFGELFVAPTDVKLSEHDVVVPDLFVIAAGRQAIVGETYIHGAPDLIVEILSPSTRVWDQIRKSALYATSGVREYWMVDPQAKSVDVLTLKDGAYEPAPQEQGMARSLIFPSFVVDVADLFAGLD